MEDIVNGKEATYEETTQANQLDDDDMMIEVSRKVDTFSYVDEN